MRYLIFAVVLLFELVLTACETISTRHIREEEAEAKQAHSNQVIQCLKVKCNEDSYCRQLKHDIAQCRDTDRCTPAACEARGGQVSGGLCINPPVGISAYDWLPRYMFQDGRRLECIEILKQKILKAQERLKSEGMDPGPINGEISPLTLKALLQYHKVNQLPSYEKRQLDPITTTLDATITTTLDALTAQ